MSSGKRTMIDHTVLTPNLLMEQDLEFAEEGKKNLAMRPIRVYET